MISYDSYRKQMESIGYEKKLLNDLVRKFRMESIEYHNYLRNNPYRKDFMRLKTEVERQRRKLIGLIPEWK